MVKPLPFSLLTHDCEDKSSTTQMSSSMIELWWDSSPATMRHLTEGRWRNPSMNVQKAKQIIVDIAGLIAD